MTSNPHEPDQQGERDRHEHDTNGRQEHGADGVGPSRAWGHVLNWRSRNNHDGDGENDGKGFDGRRAGGPHLIDTTTDTDDGGKVVRLPVPAPRTGGPDTRTDTSPDERPEDGPDAAGDRLPDGGPDMNPDAGSAAVAVPGPGVDVDLYVRDAPPGLSGEDGGGLARVEIVPAWLRDRESLVGLVRERAVRAWRVAAFHAVRSPGYWARLSGRAPAGAARLVRAGWGWTTDLHGRRVSREVALGTTGLGAQEAQAYHRVVDQHREAMRRRLIAAGVVLLAVVLGVVLLFTVVPVAPRLLVLLVGLPVLGWVGRPDGAGPIIPSATTAAGVAPVLDSALILRALGALGIGVLNKGLKDEGIGFASPIHRDGPGWRVDIDLPAGVPAGDVIERRDQLAAGLRRPLSCVWPEADPDAHEARLILWVGDRPMSKQKPRPWPLAQRGNVDLFEPFPLGTDQRGREVTMTLMFASMVIGAMPRYGKTFFMRLVFLAAALDVRAELHVHNLKGGIDWRPLGLVAHRYRSGDTDEDIQYLAEDLKALRAEMSRRYKVLESLSEAECPEGKVSTALANRKGLGLHPIVIGADECQYGFEHPTFGKQIEADATDLIKRGPAVGICLLLATQRPDAKSIPPGIGSNAALRFCLKVLGQVENDMVLGTSMYKAGVRATMFARSDVGVGILAGEGDAPKITRADFIDGAAAKSIAARARALRIAAGTLSGYAADLDHTPERPEDGPTLLDDLAAVLAAGEGKVRSEDLIARLIEYRPEPYTGWTPADLGNAVKPFGLDTVQVAKRDGEPGPDGKPKLTNRRGLDPADVHAAFTKRDTQRNQNADGGSDSDR